jgi:integrase/recombinase XerD
MAYVPVDFEAAVRKECKRRRYSEKTAQTYISCMKKFLDFTGKGLDKISKKDVRLFLEHLSESGRTGNTMNVYHMAIRFLFEEVLDKRMWIDIHYSKVPEKIPVLLTKAEVRKLFTAIINPKHRLMIEVLYSTGLRVSEFLNLKVADLNITNNYGFVRHGKGGKDRFFIISEKLKENVIDLIQNEQLSEESFLFTSNRNRKYSARSVQQILGKAARKSGIKKKINPHALRHSFATHLIENGYSVSEVQALLGHKSPDTTMIYVHMASPTLIKIKSPFDDL